MKLFTRLFLLTICFALQAGAQAPASLSGAITDPSGAAVAGVEVSARGPAPGDALVARSTSGADGSYSLALPPGRYRVRVEPASAMFARVEREFIFLAGETRAWSIRLNLERLSATVVVTSQAEPAPAESVSAPVTTLTREEIDARQAVWLAPLLAATPGLAFSRLGREGGVTSLFLNGGNSNFTKVFVDGAVVNEPGGATDFSNFSLDNVEKVEIVRGAESALYGSDAMTGVIHVFTRRGSTRRPVLELLAEGGKFETARGALNLSGLVGPFDYSASASRFETGGQGPNDSFRNTTLSANFGLRTSETSRLRLALRSAASDVGAPGQTLFTPPNLDQRTGLRNFSAGLAFEFEAGPRWRHRFSASESYIRQLFDNPASDFCLFDPPFICDFAFTSRNQFNRAGFSQQASYVAPRGALTAGYQLDVENGFLGRLHARRNNHGGYLEARWQAGPRLSLIAGARAEGNASFGARVVPRAGLSYALRDGNDTFGATRLRFSYGLGIKEPTLTQSFADEPCFPGNPGLRPERSRSLSAGVTQALASDRVRVSADWFDNRFRDIVSFTSCFGGGPCPLATPPACTLGFFGTFFNTDRARAYGTTVAVEARPARWLRVSGNYSYVNSRVLESPNAFDPALSEGNRLFKRPTQSGSLVFTGGWRRLNGTLTAVFVGPRTDSDFLSIRFGSICQGPCQTENPGYARVDLATSYEFTRHVTAFSRIENLFNNAYQDSLGYPALSRSFRAGLKLRLGGE